ncbi:MAG: hypothetical protein V4501_07765 [Pseudomonadota bacterium]
MAITNPLSNKTALICFTHASKKASEFSIQKILFKANGEYEVSCLAAQSPDAEKTARKGKYTIKNQSDKQIVLDADEETGQFVGKYQVTMDLLNPTIGKVLTKRIGSKGEGMAEGVFQIL